MRVAASLSGFTANTGLTQQGSGHPDGRYAAARIAAQTSGREFVPFVYRTGFGGIGGSDPEGSVTWSISPDCAETDWYCGRDLPSLSPDAQTAAYNDWSWCLIYTAPVGGGSEQQVFGDEENWDDCGWDPQWSPDGQHILFAGYTPEASGIFEMNADGSDVHPVKTDSGYENQPQFSPDGTQFTYVDGYYPSVAIYVADADGSNAYPVSSPTGQPTPDKPRWMPDGSHITFMNDWWPSASAYDIWMVSASGAQAPQRLTDARSDDHTNVQLPEGVLYQRGFWDPDFSVDGGWIYYVDDRSYNYAGRDTGIWRMRDDGSGQSEPVIDNGPGVGNGHWFDSPRMPQPSTTVQQVVRLRPVIEPKEERGGHNPSEHRVRCSCADPVDPATGNYFESAADVAVPARGVPLTLTRTYNSNAAADDGRFGRGWSDNWGTRLEVDQGVATVVQENGSTVSFVEQPDGTYVAPARVMATLVHESNGSWTFVRRHRLVFRLSPTGELTREEDLNGAGVSLSYDSAGKLSEVQDDAGRALQLTYTGSHVTAVEDPAGRTTTYGYDGGDLSSVTDPTSRTWSFTYDDADRLLTRSDPLDHVLTRNAYDDDGRVSDQWDALDHHTAFAYGNGATDVTYPSGRVDRHRFRDGALVSLTRAFGTDGAQTTRYAHAHASFALITETDGNDHSRTWTYDSDGNVLSSTDAQGHTTSFTYDDVGDRTSETDANGITTSWTYDDAGNLLTAVQPTGQPGNPQDATTHYIHGDSQHPGDITEIDDPVGREEHFAYNAAGDEISHTDGAGDLTTYTVNEDGWVTAVVSGRGNEAGADPSHFTTTYDDDDAGRLTGLTTPLGAQTTISYDPAGREHQRTDPDNKTTTWTYDDAGRITAIERPDQSVQETDYNADGNVTMRSNGLGKETHYEYDLLGQRTARIDPLGRRTRYAYDPAGNLTTVTRPDGAAVTTTYTAADWLKTIKYDDNATPDVTYSYDNDGRRTLMSDGVTGASYGYDIAGRLTSVSTWHGSTAYAYDLAGDVTAITYPSNQTIQRGYDDAGRLSSVTDWNAKETDFSYNSDSQLTSSDFTAAGDQDTVNYDRDGRASSVEFVHGSDQLASISYVRDALGRVTSSTPTGLPDANRTIGHDALGRITTDGTQTNNYDDADQVLAFGDRHDAVYDDAGQLRSIEDAQGTTTFSYNREGDRTRARLNDDPSSRMRYDQADRLTSVLPSPADPQIAASGSHGLGLSSGGRVMSWGADAHGQLGDGASADHPAPQLIDTVFDATVVRAGADFSLALTSNGDVYAFGDNGSGQLGLASTQDAGTATKLGQLSAVAGIAAGRAHALAVRENGEVKAWGDNSHGQLGDGTTTDAHAPQAVGGLPDIKALTAGADASFALSADGHVWSWGDNSSGQLGRSGDASTPHQIPSLEHISEIAAGADFALALSNDGTVYAWGANAHGQLGDGSTADNPNPTAVNGLANVVEIAAGAHHALAADQNGGLLVWGADGHGQLGDNASGDQTTPQQIWDLSGVASVSAGGDTSFAIDGVGQAYGWGQNDHGQLGLGGTTAHSSPTQLSGYSANAGPHGVRFTYDGDGLRASKDTGSSTDHYAWDLRGGLPMLLSDGTNSYLYGPNGQVIEKIASDGTTTSYLHHDQLGSVRLITDGAGAAVGKFTYSSWGAPTGSTGTATSPFGFAGEYTDAETGLQYLRSRYYDPATAQFTTRDPLEDQTRQPYAYAGDDPIDRVDPRGLMEMGPGGGGVPGEIAEEPISGAGGSSGEPVAGERPTEWSPDQEQALEKAADGDPVPDAAQSPDAADPANSCPGQIGGPGEFDPTSLTGQTAADVKGRIPSSWVKAPSKSGGGEVFRDPENQGRQIRIMPGYGKGVRPDPVTAGPYAVVSQNGIVTKVPLAGNPTLP